MKSILTPEEKKILKSVCRYLASYGVKSGSITIDLDQGELNPDDFDFNDSMFSHFDNNYYVQIPSVLLPILEKSLRHVYDNGLIEYPDEEYLDYSRLEFEVDCETSSIILSYTYSYTETGDVVTTEWSVSDESDSVRELFTDLENIEPHANEDGELQLYFNGGGDSGYLDDFFSNVETQVEVPAYIEDWCLSQLESNHGGWEINEGSQGSFTFDLVNEKVYLNFSMNFDEHEFKEIFNESF